MADDNVAIAREVVAALWERGESAPVDDYYAGDFVNRTVDWAPGITPDRAGMKQFVEAYAAAFPGKRVTVDDAIAQGDKVVLRWTMRGKHDGELMGIPASGNDVTLSGVAIYRFANGKVAEEWEFGDTLGLMRQIGAVPAMQPA